MFKKNQAIRISLIYMVVGLLWMVLADNFVAYISPSPERVALLTISKGGSFIVVTAIVLYFITHHYIRQLSAANTQVEANYAELKETHDELTETYENLTATYQELTAAEEELRLHFDELLAANGKVRNQNAFLATLQDLSMGLINQFDEEELLAVILNDAAKLIGAQHAFICFGEKDKEKLDLKAGVGLFKDPAGKLELASRTGQIGQVFQNGQVSIINEYDCWPERISQPLLDGVKAIIQVPIKTDNQVIGTIGLAFTENGRKFEHFHGELLGKFASLASIALENARLHAQLQSKLIMLEKQEEAVRAIFDANNDAVILHDAETGEIYNANVKAAELFGYSIGEMKQLGALKADSFPESLKVLAVIRKVAKEGPELREWTTLNKFGQPLELEVNLRKTVIDGQDCVLSCLRDISERKRTNAELDRAKTQKLALLDAIPDLFLLFNQQGVYLDYNQPRHFQFLVEPDKFLGDKVTNVLPQDIGENYLRCIQNTITSGTTQYYEYSLSQGNKELHWDVRFVKSGQEEVVAIVRDITDSKQMAKQLEFLSLNDVLTNVYNRTFFEEEIMRLKGKNKQVGIVICDVDGLKLINDTLGHRAGDELLRIVANILKNTFSPQDVVARIGGDEFAVLVAQPEQLKLKEIDDVIQTAVKQYNQEAPQLPLSISVGWSANFETCDNIDSLLKEADNNMYREKMHKGLSARGAIVETLMHALEARDYLTEGHADRLHTLVDSLARKTGLPPHKYADLRLFAKFHDIGKVGIDDSILFKAGRLTPEEMTVMRRHCEIGFRIARSSPDLSTIAEWILKHQEWWNGDGYPLGLAGEDIPLECRILALADAFDAMTNDRPYRKAFQIQQAMAEIRKCAGTQFDPNLTEAFVEIVGDG